MEPTERSQRRHIAWWAAIGALLTAGAALLGGCSNPTRNADAIAEKLGFSKAIVSGQGFRHVVYRNLAPTQDGHLHVYIEGDGTPYSRPTAVAADPTPRNPLMLRLMAQDDAASVYLGRPCYFDPIHDPVCRPRFWTIARYGPQVLDSMEAAVRSEAVRSGAVREDIFGLSGGGSIAVLLAQRLDTVTRVVTIGANLDLDAWCELHRYSPLAESINPAAQHPARANLEVLHLVGEHDLNTPPFLVQAAARARGGERVQVVEHFDHVCCWEVLWRDILNGPP